ncbi:hypothetical protein M8J76_014508 [Diaphorina citri]|nr:hypothetical protein M8J75_013068 [Diaphorina citri]KAI5737535.1 hypothetical protein M8J76_014508 [Diaphorina citri]
MGRATSPVVKHQALVERLSIKREEHNIIQKRKQSNSTISDEDDEENEVDEWKSKPEEEEDVEVDVEECSDYSNDAPVSRKRKSRSDYNSDDEKSESGDRDSPVSKNKIRTRCNCAELLVTECHLETKELWDKFHDLGTEMIITKTGR